MKVERIKSEDVQNVDEIDTKETMGSRDKVYEAFSGRLFGELFSELKENPNCKYDTYLNDLVKSGYTPEWVMAYKKYGSEVHKEIVANRILQFMDCPVAYETIIEEDGGWLPRLLSVDFVSQGDEFFTLNEFKDYSVDIEMIDECLNIATKSLSSKIGNIPNKNSRLQRMKNDIMYSYLVRKLILGDIDSGTQNFGIILNNDTVKAAPNFDLEGCFDEKSDITERVADFDLNFIKEKYPEVYEKFLIKVRELKALNPKTNTSNYEMILEDTLNGAGNSGFGDYNKMAHFIRRNIRTIESLPNHSALYM